jgi:integrase
MKKQKNSHARTFNPSSSASQVRPKSAKPLQHAFESNIITPAQLKALLAGAKDVESILYLAISAFSGLRPAELERLSWDLIQLGEGIAIPPQIAKHPVGRRVPILPVLEAWLRPFHGSQGWVIAPSLTPRKVQRLAYGRHHVHVATRTRSTVK